MKRLRLTGSLFILLIILSLCGCGGNSAVTESAAATETQTETVTETKTEEPAVTVFGKTYPQNAAEIVLDKDEITSFDELLSALGQFSDLSVIDLGDFELSREEMNTLTDGFPDADVKCRVYTLLSGKKIYTTDTKVDLSGVYDINITELKNALSSLPAVTLVTTDAVITAEEKESLCSEFPYITFDITGILDLFGMKIRDDAEEIVLSDTEIDAGRLTAELKRLPSLKKADLSGLELSAAEQTALVKEFSGVRFRFTVDVLGEKYDSDTDDLDLSGKKELTADTMRAVIPLMAGLKRVDMSDCGSTNEELAALREEFPEVKIVWRLKMGKWSLKTDAVAFSVLIYNYDYKPLTTEDIQCLKYCTDLRALDLGHQAITDISVIGDHLSELRILILADNKLNDISPVAKLKHLHYIELFVNRPLKDVSPLGECKELVDVNISYLHSITDISALLDLPMLERFWIVNSELVPSNQLQLLRETYKDAKIVTKGENALASGWREHPRYFTMIDMFQKTDYISEEFSKYDR